MTCASNIPSVFKYSLEQLDRIDIPHVPEEYAMTVAFNTLLALVNSIDILVKSTLKTKQTVDLEDWIESSEGAIIADETNIGTNAFENTDEGWFCIAILCIQQYFSITAPIFAASCVFVSCLTCCIFCASQNIAC